ncbi:tripartite motif-containing protein 7-like [Platysternon megacephalum]|uniref:Tripartite motif-containing protein 7-like n=1 Tax=Platysternon megacephalum TaxID=55544 RepID=A0A4D9ELU6_9SAUR|nr:tripartite motif-containing protein 7-like [Platysternon megacephalum]
MQPWDMTGTSLKKALQQGALAEPPNAKEMVKTGRNFRWQGIPLLPVTSRSSPEAGRKTHCNSSVDLHVMINKCFCSFNVTRKNSTKILLQFFLVIRRKRN